MGLNSSKILNLNGSNKINVFKIYLFQEAVNISCNYCYVVINCKIKMRHYAVVTRNVTRSLNASVAAFKKEHIYKE